MHSIFIIFGSTGDLAKRKLFPALYSIYKNNKKGKIDIIGVGRRNFDNKNFHDFISKETDNFILKSENFNNFLNKITYSKVELSSSYGYIDLKKQIDSMKNKK